MQRSSMPHENINIDNKSSSYDALVECLVLLKDASFCSPEMKDFCQICKDKVKTFGFSESGWEAYRNWMEQKFPAEFKRPRTPENIQISTRVFMNYMKDRIPIFHRTTGDFLGFYNRRIGRLEEEPFDVNDLDPEALRWSEEKPFTLAWIKENCRFAQQEPYGLASIKEITKDNKTIHFETGKPVEFSYMRRKEKAPDMRHHSVMTAEGPLVDPYQQAIEPHGLYMIHQTRGTEPTEGWETGVANFQNPLVVKMVLDEKGRIYGETSWKARLSKAFGNKTGLKLSQAIIKAGYDGIVTVYYAGGNPGYVGEIVDLRPIKNKMKPV